MTSRDLSLTGEGVGDFLRGKGALRGYRLSGFGVVWVEDEMKYWPADVNAASMTLYPIVIIPGVKNCSSFDLEGMSSSAIRMGSPMGGRLWLRRIAAGNDFQGFVSTGKGAGDFLRGRCVERKSFVRIWCSVGGG
ncbi:hypothetical protein CEXT_11991 [Caerostris extrusa]|uniref:Uncharacterized protein n=1 Tax=Caerostris extrusa TaxID=172846 RepID=A0AAV4Y818_CAEEX|nr:hypothetical protein CEXT_11991 [Caerostris extrusa]